MRYLHEVIVMYCMPSHIHSGWMDGFPGHLLQQPVVIVTLFPYIDPITPGMGFGGFVDNPYGPCIVVLFKGILSVLMSSSKVR